MKRKVAVEDGLKNVSSYLQNQGCDVCSLKSSESNFDKYDAIVVSGQDKDFLGMEDTMTNSSVIDARGKTPEEIYSQLQNNMK